MKVEATKKKTVFEPVILTIRLETKDEARALAALFNFTPVLHSMQQMGFPGTHGISNAIVEQVDVDRGVKDLEAIILNHPAMRQV